MKIAIITVIFACLATVSIAQDESVASAKDSLVSLTPEEMEHIQVPKYVGGIKALLKFLRRNVKYPPQALPYKVEGRVVMSFFVDTDGTVNHISAIECKILNIGSKRFKKLTTEEQEKMKEGFCLMFAKEAARVMRFIPKWIPGEENGKPVRVKYHLPIHFMPN